MNLKSFRGTIIVSSGYDIKSELKSAGFRFAKGSKTWRMAWTGGTMRTRSRLQPLLARRDDVDYRA